MGREGREGEGGGGTPIRIRSPNGIRMALIAWCSMNDGWSQREISTHVKEHQGKRRVER